MCIVLVSLVLITCDLDCIYNGAQIWYLSKGHIFIFVSSVQVVSQVDKSKDQKTGNKHLITVV